jgi:alkylation response protein AidB-like acyl-CoA dehydrogenase
MNLVERTTALVPMLRQHAAAAENERRVPLETLEALDQAGVFRMMAPKKFGGDEADFETQARVLAEIGRACPSTSWVATIYSAMGWAASAFPDQAQEEVFAGGVPRIAGVFSPTGTAVRHDGGFIVNGRWPYNTGCHGAQWTVVVALAAPDGGDPAPHCALVRSRELTILDDWHASGMAGTGSNTVVAEGVFVPGHRVLPLPDMVEGRYPKRHNSGNPYFNYPLAQVLTVNAGGTPLGIARGALEAFFDRLPGRGIMYTTYADKSAAPVTHLQVGEASLKIDSASAHVQRATALLDGLQGRALTVQDRVRSRAHIGYATGLAREAVDLLFYASGASSIQSHVPMQRFQRDMQALANHAIMHAPTAVELHGRVLCGLEPNTPLY